MCREFYRLQGPVAVSFDSGFSEYEIHSLTARAGHSHSQMMRERLEGKLK